VLLRDDLVGVRVDVEDVRAQVAGGIEIGRGGVYGAEGAVRANLDMAATVKFFKGLDTKIEAIVVSPLVVSQEGWAGAKEVGLGFDYVSCCRPLMRPSDDVVVNTSHATMASSAGRCAGMLVVVSSSNRGGSRGSGDVVHGS
jgi:hypothetical protein